MMPIVVVSTGQASPSKEKNLASVAGQRGVDIEHRYVESAGQQPRELGAMQNQYEAIQNLHSEQVVCLVDGDDWLPHFECIARVAKEHDAGAWMTWGSFAFADGRNGMAGPYLPDENPRAVPWKMTHLKSFRAGLFQRIKHADLCRDGDWLLHARDLAVMFPIFEMCPPERRRFISDIIYTYNLAASFEWTAKPDELAHEKADVEHVRGLPRYERVSAL